MRRALLVCRRELASMCGGPLAWILGAVFALLTGYFFYSDLALFVLVGGTSETRGLWRFVFLDDRLVVLLVVPLLTMRLFAEERKLGTLEFLWTCPVRDGEDRKSTRLNSSHVAISYAVFCLKKKKQKR